MARCFYHPDVETGVTCTTCGKPICPKEWVDTPVGYKCPDHGRPKRSQYIYVKPKQLVGGAALGLLAGVLGGWLLGMFGFTFFLISWAWGALVGEAVRRGSGGHRGPIMAAVAAICVVAGGLLGQIGLLGIGLAIVGVVMTLGWGWGK
jgi:hypothetical protein